MRHPSRSVLSLGSFLAPLLVLTFTHPAHADECMTDMDCGHGFSCSSSLGSSTGGASSGSGGAASGGTGSGSGGASAGTVGSVPAESCGDGLCQTLSEDSESCPEDCVVYRECTPNGCITDADCADTYTCGQFVAHPGGASGLCIAQTVYCSTDSDCPANDYCFIVGSSGSSSGAGGFAGTANGSGGFGAGGTGGDAGMGTSGSTASMPIQGVCVARDQGGGTGGVSAGGSGGMAESGTGGLATGGTSTGGTGTGGIAGTESGGAPSGAGGTKSNATGGSHDVVTHGGCAVSPRRERSPFAALALVGLALAWVTRRRVPPSVRR